MGKTRGLFKRIGDTQGTFYASSGTIKDRNGKDLTEAEEIKNRWQEYTELQKTGLNDLENHDGVTLTQSQTYKSVKSSGPQEALYLYV